MREIYFRGKTFNGDWIHGDLVRTNGSTGDGWAIQYYDEENGWITEDVQQRSIGQFTGMVDANDLHIFEGDVVNVFLTAYDDIGRFRGKTDLKPYYRAVVSWNERECRFEMFLEENEQCGDHHILSCGFGWGGEKFLVVGRFIEMPFKLQKDKK